MREIRPSGLEGGAGSIPGSYPYPARRRFHVRLGWSMQWRVEVPLWLELTG
jgi:hypothetical protein